MTAEPTDAATADRATSDPTPLLPTITPAAGPADHVTAAEIVEFLHHLARTRPPAPGADPAELLARKANLFTRITEQNTHAAAGPPAPTPPEGHNP